MDTRSDIYNLGLLLFKILCPSKSIKDLKQGLEGPDFDQFLRQNLKTFQAILNKATATDPEDRYENVHELLSDVSHVQNHLPISARSASRQERLRLWWRRNRLAGSFSAAFLILLLFSFGAITKAYFRAEQSRESEQSAKIVAENERQRTQEVNQFLTELLTAPQPEFLGRQARIRDLLPQAEKDVLTLQDPQIKTDLLLVIAKTHLSLESIADCQRLLSAIPEGSQKGILNSDLLIHQGRYQEAQALLATLPINSDTNKLRAQVFLKQNLLEQAAEVLQNIPQNKKFRTLHAQLSFEQGQFQEVLNRLGGSEDLAFEEWRLLSQSLRRLDRASDAQTVLKRGLEKFQKRFGEYHPQTLTMIQEMANLQRQLGQMESAEKLLSETRQNFITVLGPDHPETLAISSDYGLLLQNVGRLDEAKALLQKNLEISLKILGPNHINTISSSMNLGDVLVDLNQLRQAEHLYRQAYRAVLQTYGPTHPLSSGVRNNLARILQDLGQLFQAENLIWEAFQNTEKSLGPDHMHTLIIMKNLVDILRDQNQFSEAIRLNQDLIKRWKHSGKKKDDLIGFLMVQSHIGYLHNKVGQLPDAIHYFSEVVEMAEKELPWNHSHLLVYRRYLAMALALFEPEKAQNLYCDINLINEEVYGSDHLVTYQTRAESIGAWLGSGDTELARKETQSILTNRPTPNSPRSIALLNILARMYQDHGYLERATELQALAVEQVETHLGQDHRYYPLFNRRYALLLHQTQPQKAKPLLRECAAQAMAELGPESPITQNLQFHLGQK